MLPSLTSPAALAFDTNTQRTQARWRTGEFAFWLLPEAAYFVFFGDLALLSRIATMALFASSLKLIPGCAGAVSSGHAAFFGLGAYGAYGAAMLARNGFGDPLLGLIAAGGLAAAVGLVTAFCGVAGYRSHSPNGHVGRGVNALRGGQQDDPVNRWARRLARRHDDTAARPLRL